MLVYLNGTSSSGKTSIAHELQKLIQKPVLYFSIDTLLYSFAKEDLEAIKGKRPYRSEINWDRVFFGYLGSVASLVRTENHVIADLPIYYEDLANVFNQTIGPLPSKRLVGIECPISVLDTRELARQDRARGVARRQFEGIHKYLNYDLTVHSDANDPPELARAIYKQIETII